VNEVKRRALARSAMSGTYKFCQYPFMPIRL